LTLDQDHPGTDKFRETNPATAMISETDHSRPVSMKVSVERGAADTITETGQSVAKHIVSSPDLAVLA